MNFEMNCNWTRFAKTGTSTNGKIMNKIYVVGVMEVDRNDPEYSTKKSSRVWYFFVNFADAEKCVIENQCNIFEYSYNIALIEEHYVYDPQDPPKDLEDRVIAKQWWYEAIFTEPDNPIVSKIEPPRQFENVFNFWAS